MCQCNVIAGLNTEACPGHVVVHVGQVHYTGLFSESQMGQAKRVAIYTVYCSSLNNLLVNFLQKKLTHPTIKQVKHKTPTP